MDIRQKSLQFLHEWVNKNHIPGIRKGMVEDLEKFVTDIAAHTEMRGAVNRMVGSPLKEQLESIKAEKEQPKES